MTDVRTTQTAAEEWFAPAPEGRVTQVGIECWVSVGTTTIQALVTTAALEEWIRVDSAAMARQFAVSVIT